MLETAEMPAAGAAGGNGSPQARFFHGFLTLIQGFPPHKSVSGHMGRHGSHTHPPPFQMPLRWPHMQVKVQGLTAHSSLPHAAAAEAVRKSREVVCRHLVRFAAEPIIHRARDGERRRCNDPMHRPDAPIRPSVRRHLPVEPVQASASLKPCERAVGTHDMKTAPLRRSQERP